MHFSLLLRRLQPDVTPADAVAARMGSGTSSNLTFRMQPTKPSFTLVFPAACAPGGKPPSEVLPSRSRWRAGDTTSSTSGFSLSTVNSTTKLLLSPWCR